MTTPPNSPKPKRKHVRTGRPPGPPPGSQNFFKHGMKSSAFFAERKRVADLLRAAREALRESSP